MTEDNNMTARPTEGMTRRPMQGEELLPLADTEESVQGEGGTDGATFMLGGKVWQEEETLSRSSGEAKVMLVSHDGQKAVLKLYYPGYAPEEGVCRTVWNTNFELIVRLYDYGRTVVGGVTREYELMEHLEGISLSDYSLRGDLMQFRRIALSAAAALTYVHNCGVIHKDVKPGNFIFRDKECKELVLTDFGISALTAEGETTHKTTQARTPLYAAPEMYENVIDGEVELTVGADFYSLGIVLFALWTGKNPFDKNERAMMRLKSEGRLPGVEALPPAVNRLVRGLTARNPEKRWGYDEVERWYRGEEPEVDESSVYLRYKSFVVDSEKNVLAADAQELAECLSVRRHLGIKYLYGKVISAWLRECGNSKMAVELDDITDKRYPLNPEAGFRAALYVLNPALPYTDGKGADCTNVHEVVMAMLSDPEGYKLTLRDANHPLYVYLEMTTERDVERLKGHFQRETPEVAFWRMVYEVDDTVPFLPDKPSGTVEEIVRSFADLPCRDDEWLSLTDGRLLSWLHYKYDSSLCMKLEELCSPTGSGETDGEERRKNTSTRSKAYRVLYHLKPEVGFDLREATERNRVAALMADELIKAQTADEEEFVRCMEEYIGKESRLVYYAERQGWRDVLALHRSTFDLHATEHTARYGVYDLRTAAYRFCAALGYIPHYYLRTTGQLIGSLEEFRQVNADALRAEMRGGCLKQWLTLFFHEDPHCPFEEKYSYEQALADYLQEVGRIDPDDEYYRRFRQASEEGHRLIVSSRRRSTLIRRREQRLSLLFMGTAALLCLLMVVFGFSNPERLLTDAPFGVWLPVGGILMLITASWSYFHGNGVLGTLLYAAAGFAAGGIPVWVLRLIGADRPGGLVAASVGMVLCCVALAWWTGKKKRLYRSGDLKPLMQENVNHRLLDPLYFTYRQRSLQFKGSAYKTLEDTVAVMNATRVELYVHYALWIAFMCLPALLLICFHADLLDLPVPDVRGMLHAVGEIFKS